MTREEIRLRKILIDEAKKDMRDEEKAKAKVARRLARRCWWTRPFGHRYGLDTTSPYRDVWHCLVCGKEKDMEYHDDGFYA